MNRSTSPGPPADVAAGADGDRWTLVFVRDLPHPPRAGVGGAHRPGPAAPMGAVHRRPRPRHHRRPATLTMVDGDARRRTSPATVQPGRAADAARVHLGRRTCCAGSWRPTGTGTRLTLRHTIGRPRLAAQGRRRLAPVPGRRRPPARRRPGRPDPRARTRKNHGWDELHDAYAGSWPERRHPWGSGCSGEAAKLWPELGPGRSPVRAEPDRRALLVVVEADAVVHPGAASRPSRTTAPAARVADDDAVSRSSAGGPQSSRCCARCRRGGECGAEAVDRAGLAVVAGEHDDRLVRRPVADPADRRGELGPPDGLARVVVDVRRRGVASRATGTSGSIAR